MAFPAFLDTCVLHQYHLCDLMLRLAETRTYRPLWSDDVLRELEGTLTEVAGLERRQVRRRLDAMREHFPDAEVEGYAALVPTMTCDEKDRHVLAAAVRANAEVLVTFNVADFPRSAVEPYDLRVIDPDTFLLDQLDLHPDGTATALRRQAASYGHPRLELAELLQSLERTGVPDFVAALRQRSSAVEDQNGS